MGRCPKIGQSVAAGARRGLTVRYRAIAVDPGQSRLEKMLFGTRTVFRYKWIRRSHVTAGSDRRVTFSPGAGRHRSIGRDRAARNRLVMVVVTISSTKRRGSMFLAQPPAVALRAPLLLNEPQSTLR